MSKRLGMIGGCTRSFSKVMNNSSFSLFYWGEGIANDVYIDRVLLPILLSLRPIHISSRWMCRLKHWELFRLVCWPCLDSHKDFWPILAQRSFTVTDQLWNEIRAVEHCIAACIWIVYISTDRNWGDRDYSQSCTSDVGISAGRMTYNWGGSNTWMNG